METRTGPIHDTNFLQVVHKCEIFIVLSSFGVRAHPWRLNLNSGFEVMQMDVSVGRVCGFLLVFCVFACTTDFGHLCIFRDFAWCWAFMRGREYARRLILNSEYAVMQIDAPVGRTCGFLLVVCVFAWMGF